MGYRDNKEHKRIIDCVLKQNASLFQNLGQDSPRSGYEEAKIKERQMLVRITNIDPEKINRLIQNSDE